MLSLSVNVINECVLPIVVQLSQYYSIVLLYLIILY